MKENPLYAVLELAIDRKSNQIVPGATIGFVHKKDTAKVAEYFRLAKQKRIVPQGLTPRWSVTPDKNREDMFELFAINCKRKDAKAPLAGSVIVDPIIFSVRQKKTLGSAQL